MRKSILLGGFAAFLIPFSSLRAELLIELKFDETGSSLQNSGEAGGSWSMFDEAGAKSDLHGSSGITGSCFENNARGEQTPETRIKAGGVFCADKLEALDELVSLTICGWMKDVPETLGDGAVIFQKTASAVGPGVYLTYENPGTLSFHLNDQPAISSTPKAYAPASDGWIFFAVTYDSNVTAENVRFYVGAKGMPLELVNSASALQTPIIHQSNLVGIGNTIFGERNGWPFLGALDNFRLYGSPEDGAGCLTREQLQAVLDKDAP